MEEPAAIVDGSAEGPSEEADEDADGERLAYAIELLQVAITI